MGKIRTFLRHAFGFRTLAPISVSGLSGYMGISNMQLLMDDPIAVVTVAVFLVAGLITWATVGYDGYKAEQRDGLMAGMDLNIREIMSKLPPEPVSIPASLQNLSAVSSDEIRRAVLSLTVQMREFGNQVKLRQTQEMLELGSRSFKTDAERRADWNEKTNQHILSGTANNSEFNTKYRPAALAYRDEMRRRLGVGPDADDWRQTALNKGMLAGVNPVTEAADYLEKLARQLP